MNRPDEQSTANADPLTRGDVQQWRSEAEEFFLHIRRELSCLTGETPVPSKKPSLVPPPSPLKPVSPAAPHDELESTESIVRDLHELREHVAPTLEPAPGSTLPAAAPASSSAATPDPVSDPAPAPPGAAPQADDKTEPQANDEDRLAELKRQIAAKLAEQSQPPTPPEEGA